jgi:hypothetical protein
MSKRKYCVFLYGKPCLLGQVFQYTGEQKAQAKREHQLLASPLVMMRAYPSVPVLMATPFSSLREAVGWYSVGTGLFSPQAFHGVVRRLKNGRGWKVVHINRDFGHERTLEKLKMHSVYGAHAAPKPGDWREAMDYFAKRLHGMGLEELTHAFMEQQKINPNEKNAFSCRAVGLVDAAPDREFQNDWVHPDGFPKFATKIDDMLTERRDVKEKMLNPPFLGGMDPGHPDGDKTSVVEINGIGKSFMSMVEMAKFSPGQTTIDKMGGEVQLIMEPFPHTVVVEKKP